MKKIEAIIRPSRLEDVKQALTCLGIDAYTMCEVRGGVLGRRQTLIYRCQAFSVEEQLQIILGSWAQGPFTFDGEHYRLRELDAQPKPAQRPRPPIIIGGTAGPRSAAVAARYADEYNTVFATPAEVRERRAVVERACEAAGRDPLPFSMMTCVLLGRDRGELEDRARRLAELTGGDAGALLAEPPSGWIVGTLEDAAAQIAALGDAGLHRIMCQHLQHDDLDAVALIGRELPALL